MSGKLFNYLVFLSIFALTPVSIAFADLNFILQWDENTEPDLVGYRIYYRTGELPYNNANSPSAWLIASDELPGDSATFQATESLPDDTRYIAVTAYDSEGLESDFTEIAVINPGDINHDNSVDLQDAILANLLLAGMAPSTAIYLDADANTDSRIGLEDLIYIMQKVSDRR